MRVMKSLIELVFNQFSEFIYFCCSSYSKVLNQSIYGFYFYGLLKQHFWIIHRKGIKNTVLYLFVLRVEFFFLWGIFLWSTCQPNFVNRIRFQLEWGEVMIFMVVLEDKLFMKNDKGIMDFYCKVLLKPLTNLWRNLLFQYSKLKLI